MSGARKPQPVDQRGTGGARGVIGLGNPLRGDDGIVPVLFDRLRATERVPDVELLEFGATTLRVVHALGAFDRVLIVDAVQFGADPGEYIICTPAALASRRESNGSHEMDLLEIVDLAGRMDEAPAVVRIFGIQPGSTELGSELSDALTWRLPELQDALEGAIADL